MVLIISCIILAIDSFCNSYVLLLDILLNISSVKILSLLKKNHIDHFYARVHVKAKFLILDKYFVMRVFSNDLIQSLFIRLITKSLCYGDSFNERD